MGKTVIITGITGQDGSYMADLLLSKGYQVHGIVRRLSRPNIENIQGILNQITLHEGDLHDQSSLNTIMRKVKPDEVYNLAAQSFVGASWNQSVLTADVTGLGALRVFESVRAECPDARIYQASSITFDTPVLIRKNKEVRRTTFGDTLNMVDFEVLSVDKDTKTIKFLSIRKVINHGMKDVYKVIGRNGLEIKTTADHSLMVFDDRGDIIEKKVSNIVEGDLLITFVGNLDLVDVDKTIHIEYNMNHNIPNRWRHENKTESQKIERDIDITIELMFVAGCYVAEGNCSNNDGYTINFTFGNSEFKKDALLKTIETIKNIFNIAPYIIYRDTSTILKYSSKYFYQFISMFGSNAHNKRIPSFIWNLPNELILSFLNGYSCDSHLKKNGQRRYTTINKELLIDINYLMRVNNISTYLINRYVDAHLSPQKTIIRGCNVYDTETSVENKTHKKFKSPASRCLPSKIFKGEAFFLKIKYKKLVSKKRLLQHISEFGIKNKSLLYLVNSDLGVLKVKNIEYVGKEEVGDYEVPASECFFCGNQPILAHNSSEMFGKTDTPMQHELTPFHPRSPYGVAKAFAHHIAVNFRESYGMFISNGILFNHESERRSLEFVTKKISVGVARIVCTEDKSPIQLGNILSQRDWGYAPEYVEAMWRMLQLDEPDDFVIATGKTHTIKSFLKKAFNVAGIDLTSNNWSKYVNDGTPQNTRPADVMYLCGDSSKAKRTFGWEPRVRFELLVEIMVQHEIRCLEG